ncbi:MAG: HD domain-containing protein [Armatimonadetes bacterium]|nr:HD domain-containing protein [Armatimonadota bacterium]
MDYQQRLPEIEALVRETFSLWDEQRVGFSWRHYYLNHSLRVRALALTLARQEGADPDVVAYAATLHDLTKRYDGALALDANGKRRLDRDGYWVTETLPPARANHVTALYDELGLAGQVHHLSGAALTERILAEAGYPRPFINAVAHAIRAHVTPQNATAAELEALYRPPEARVLHDADLMDANLGLVAFYRNIQIHAGRALAQTGAPLDPRAYIELVAPWVETKDPFLPRFRTATGQAMAAARQERNRQLVAWIAVEQPLGEPAWHYGVLGVITLFLEEPEDPSLTRALQHLQTEWLPARRAELARDGRAPHAAALLARAEQFADLLRDEVAGRI